MAPAHTIKTLELTIGYNKSDATFGWKGFDNSLTLYYLRTRFKNIFIKPYYMIHIIWTILYGSIKILKSSPEIVKCQCIVKSLPTKSCITFIVTNC